MGRNKFFNTHIKNPAKTYCYVLHYVAITAVTAVAAAAAFCFCFVSDIAIFVLKRDVKLQLTNSVFVVFVADTWFSGVRPALIEPDLW